MPVTPGGPPRGPTHGFDPDAFGTERAPRQEGRVRHKKAQDGGGGAGRGRRRRKPPLLSEPTADGTGHRRRDRSPPLGNSIVTCCGPAPGVGDQALTMRSSHYHVPSIRLPTPYTRTAPEPTCFKTDRIGRHNNTRAVPSARSVRYSGNALNICKPLSWLDDNAHWSE